MRIAVGKDTKNDSITPGAGNMSRQKPKRSLTYWMYGQHPCAAAAGNPERRIRRVVATKAADLSWLQGHQLRPEMMEGDKLARLLPEGAVHQGVACEVEPLDDIHLDQVTGRGGLAVLDQITDPHNVGAILRSAAAFDIAALIMPKDHAPAESGVMAKAASGALELVPCVRVTNLASTLNELKEEGYWIAGLDAGGSKMVDAASEFNPLCLVLGAEGKGLRRLTAERCDIILSIPISKRMESLNVSNAAAIAFYHARKQ
jgi:23S rRNA (guanosine2251-2'-O)-methyltransferase